MMRFAVLLAAVATASGALVVPHLHHTRRASCVLCSSDEFVPTPNEDFLDFERECFKGEEECEIVWGEYSGATAGDEEVWGARKAEGEQTIARRAALLAEEDEARRRLKAMLDDA